MVQSKNVNVAYHGVRFPEAEEPYTIAPFTDKLLGKVEEAYIQHAGATLWITPRIRGPFAEIGRPQAEYTRLTYKINELTSIVKSLEKQLVVCNENIDKLSTALKERPIVKQTELYDVGKNMDVLQPIPIVVEESEGEIIARYPEVELFAVGDTESEALLNLKSAIVDLYNDLSETPKDKLGRLPLSWIRILNKVIKPSGGT